MRMEDMVLVSVDTQIDKVTHLIAMRDCQFDPFGGALRARAEKCSSGWRGN